MTIQEEIQYVRLQITQCEADIAVRTKRRDELLGWLDRALLQQGAVEHMERTLGVACWNTANEKRKGQE